MTFDFTTIIKRQDGSYVVQMDGMPYHVPSGMRGYADLWQQVDEYAKEHPEVVTEEAPYVAPEPTLEELVERAYNDFDSRVEARLDAFAATRRYSSINSACSYSTSTDPVFRAEGEYCVQARDATYRKCYDLLSEYMPDVLTGKRPIPTWEEIEAQLPPLVWPDEQIPPN